MSKKVFLSGVQPSGKPHIGNYFGAMKQFVEFQEKYEGYVMIVDYHALHSLRNPKEMHDNIIAVLLDFLAIGLDPKKVTIFKQSDISEHTELTWIFDTIITMPELERAHAYKEAMSKITNLLSKNPDFFKHMMTGVSFEQGSEAIDEHIKSGISVGTFNYPVLMAADILLYNTDIVPVGKDQQQHIEITRSLAQKFNNTYNKIFKLPEAIIIKEVAVVPGTDGRKMSKSYNNTIPLFAEHEEIKKCVMSIVTDSGFVKEDKTLNERDNPYLATPAGFPKNVYAIHKLIRPESELNKIYEENSGKYKALKEILIEDLEKFIAPLRERRKKFEKDIPAALAILKDGGERAKKVASAKMAEVRKAVGVDIYEK